MNRLADRVAIITGASRGIGEATAVRFAEEGAAVMLADINEEGGQRVAEAIRASGGKAAFQRIDVTSAEEADALATKTKETFGGIDILVNNAGITRDATIRKMEVEDFDRVIGVNLRGVFNCTRSVIPYLVEQQYGRVLNAASIVALYGNFGQTNYVASKAAVIGMTKTWARELGRKGITVNAVAPGFIQTDMIGSVPEKILDTFRDRTPVQRLGTPEDIANAYLFLASEEASFITGTVLSVDGGLVL